MCLFDVVERRVLIERSLYLRTHDLALAGHISVQQVRNYEANGLIPQAQRSPSGYRLYMQQHLVALKTVKSMVRGYGWPRTSAVMPALHRGDLSSAPSTIVDPPAA